MDALFIHIQSAIRYKGCNVQCSMNRIHILKSEPQIKTRNGSPELSRQGNARSSQTNTTARPNALRRAPLTVTPLPIAPELLVGVLPELVPVPVEELFPVAVALAEKLEGLTAVVGATLTVAVPTSTVKYEPARGSPRPAELMYVAKLRVDILGPH
jgi:hypothetical protein